jgi:hypothetical protein
MNNEHGHDHSTLETMLNIMLVSAIGWVCSGLVVVISGMQPMVA